MAERVDICFYEAFGEEVGELKRLLPADLRASFTPHTIQAAGDAAPPAPLISIRTQSIIPRAWAASLEGVLSRSAGYDHLREYHRRAGRNAPALGHLKGYCARAVAEHAGLLMLALLRHLPRQMAQVETFNREGLTGREARGRRALVVGVGSIGTELVRVCRGLGMEVRGVDIVKRHRRLGYMPLSGGVRWADVIFLCLPLTRRTQGLISHRLLSASTRRPLVINTARGELTPLADMERLLEEKKIAGLGLDVYAGEDRLGDDLRAGENTPAAAQLRRLLAREQVIGTPHNAFNTAEALHAKCRQTVEAFQYFRRRGRFPHQVS